MSSIRDSIKDKLSGYADTSAAEKWFEENLDRLAQLFSDEKINDFIFEPFKGVFESSPDSIDRDIYSVITQVAIINAVLAGLPGKMGVGVAVSIALEAWMAYSIARHIGVRIDKPVDVFKYFGLLAAVLGTILVGFRVLLGFGFSLFSVIPGVNPLVFAELFVTNLVGIVFWTGFSEAKSQGSFQVPARMLAEVVSKTKGIFVHQKDLLVNVLTPSNIQKVGERLVSYLKGDISQNIKEYNGDIFSTAAIAYLMHGHYDKLEGPLSEHLINAIRLRWSDQLGEDASIEEIASRLSEYDSDQLVGVASLIKGKMFELMVAEAENEDHDEWRAKLHSDESFPGSDIIFTNDTTDEQIEVSLKAVGAANPALIESALAKYLDTPIMTTDEVSKYFGDNPMVSPSGFSEEELSNITSDNLEQLLSRVEPVNSAEVSIGGVVVGTTAVLWPIVVAYMRGNIDQDELNLVFKHVLGDSGQKLASRLSYALVLGPVFAWFLLAKGVQSIVRMAEPTSKRKIEYISANQT